MRPLRVAVLDEELPFPLNSGKRIRTYNLIRRLADRHRVTILCHRNADAEEAVAAEKAFGSIGVETIVADRPVPSKSGPAFYARLAGNLLSPLPYSVATHTSPALAAEIRRHAASKRVDIWHCEWTPYARVLQEGLGARLAATRWAVMAHNVESLIWRRYTEAETNPMKRWYIRRQWQKFEEFERWAYTSATAAIAVSPDDAELMRSRFGLEEPAVVENGVDTDYFRPQRDVERDPARILFLGSLDWRPNLDGVALLLERIFPAVRIAMPHATLSLVGRNPPGWLREKVTATPGAQLFPDVPDVRPFLASCGLLAVPLRIGGGSRLKILEALATATPVVSTRVGAEGLDLAPDRDVVIADEPAEMAETIIRSIRHPEALRDTAECGRQVVLARYDWAHLAERLDEVWWTVATAETPVASD